MLDKQMYKVIYEAGQGKVKIVSILQKEADDWLLAKNPDIETIIEQRLFSRGHYNISNNKTGYGFFVLTDNFAFITGDFQIPKQ